MYPLIIISSEKKEFEGQVISLIAPGTLGYLEILSNHAPIITTLSPGKLTITDENNSKAIYAISGGILEVSNNKAILLADAIETPEEINYQRAEKALQRAQARIESKEDTFDKLRAKKALKRAENRMHIYRHYKHISTPSPMLAMFE